jgi:hypothetical protein
MECPISLVLLRFLSLLEPSRPFQIIKERSLSNFVDWKLQDWPRMYSKELSASVKLPFRGKEYLLPQVLLFNNVKRKLELTQVIFQLEEKTFEPPDSVRSLTEKAFQRLLKTLKRQNAYYNDENVRLIILEKMGSSFLKSSLLNTSGMYTQILC